MSERLGDILADWVHEEGVSQYDKLFELFGFVCQMYCVSDDDVAFAIQTIDEAWE